MGELRLRDESGRFLPRFCTDLNCGGETVVDREPQGIGGPDWPIARCDGLTHDDSDGPLVACERTHKLNYSFRVQP